MSINTPLCFAGVVVLVMAAASASAAEIKTLPDGGYDAPRYEKLWTRSPFAVASPEAPTGTESPDYSLVGIAQINGVSYASIIDKKSQEHFLLAGDESDHGLTLVSITDGKDVKEASAVVKANGADLTLKLEQAPVPAAPIVPPPSVATGSPPPGPAAAIQPFRPGQPEQPPLARFHHQLLHLPPRPGNLKYPVASGSQEQQNR